MAVVPLPLRYPSDWLVVSLVHTSAPMVLNRQYNLSFVAYSIGFLVVLKACRCALIVETSSQRPIFCHIVEECERRVEARRKV